jgi:hypothetical protein
MKFLDVCCFILFCVDVTKAQEEFLKVSSEASLRSALASHTPRIQLSNNLILETPLVITNSHIKIVGTGLSSSSLQLRKDVPGSVLIIEGSTDVIVQDVRISYEIEELSWFQRSAALVVRNSTNIFLDGLKIEGGISMSGGSQYKLSWSEISNKKGSQNGTCIYIPGCGDSKTLTSCSYIVHDNSIHDCRYDGVSIYVCTRCFIRGTRWGFT